MRIDKIMLVALPVVITVLLTVPLSAYALSTYHATATGENDIINNDYLITKAYCYDQDTDTFLPADPSMFASQKIPYEMSHIGDVVTYSITGEYRISAEDLYIKVDSNIRTGVCTLTPTATLHDAQSGLSDIGFRFVLRDSQGAVGQDGSGNYSVVIGQFYEIEVYASPVYSGSVAPEINVDVLLDSVYDSEGKYLTDVMTIPIRVIVTDNNGAAAVLLGFNPAIMGTTTASDFVVSDTSAGSHGTYPAANIRNADTNTGGITNKKGEPMDLEITIPQDVGFAIYLERTTGNKEISFTVSVKQGDVVIFTKNVTLKKSFTYYYGLTGQEYVSVNDVDSNNAWLFSDSSDLTVSFVTTVKQGDLKYVKMDIVFKPPQ